MNEDLIEKIALFIERQCPRKIYPGMKCSEYNCSVHWMAAQVRARKFEDTPLRRELAEKADWDHIHGRVDVMR